MLDLAEEAREEEKEGKGGMMTMSKAAKLAKDAEKTLVAETARKEPSMKEALRLEEVQELKSEYFAMRARVEALEAAVAAFKTVAVTGKAPKASKTGKTARVWTEADRKAIRERLVAGRLAKAARVAEEAKGFDAARKASRKTKCETIAAKNAKKAK